MIIVQGYLAPPLIVTQGYTPGAVTVIEPVPLTARARDLSLTPGSRSANLIARPRP